MAIDHRTLSTPWATANDLYSPPGSLIIKLVLGEDPDDIPPLTMVRRGQHKAATAMSVTSVDRVFDHLADRVRITRLHTPAAQASGRKPVALAFDDIEHVLGLSRTFRVEAGKHAPVDQMVDALRHLAVVEQAYPNYMTALPFAPVQTAAPPKPGEAHAWLTRVMINAMEALAYEAGDPATIVAIVDTGVAQHHPELTHRLRAGIDTVQLSTEQLASGLRLVGDRSRIDTDPEDAVGHGTACAAIIGARGDHLPVGLAGDCSMIAARVLGGALLPGKDTAIGIGAIADIDLGMKHVIDLGAKVINMSFGTAASQLDANDPLPHQDVVRYAKLRGCILVAASGNNGNEERFSPACLDDVIAVGSVNADGKPSAFTTYGEHVALCAPGERVYSAGLENYQWVTGTSFAAPFVSAAAALLVSRASARSYSLNSAQVRRLLCDSATPWSGSQLGYGAGILDAYGALRALDYEIDQAQARDETEVEQETMMQ